MTKEAYFYIFNKKELSKEDLIELNKKIKSPDRKAMLKGDRD